jgi:hypothetical protein
VTIPLVNGQGTWLRSGPWETLGPGHRGKLTLSQPLRDGPLFLSSLGQNSSSIEGSTRVRPPAKLEDLVSLSGLRSSLLRGFQQVWVPLH